MERIRRGFGEDPAGRIAATTAPQALYGLGGIGKTRAAIEYAHRHGEKYSALLLVRADSAQAFRTNLANLAGPLVLDLAEHTTPDEEVRLAAVLRWLDAHPGWLLIIDNVDTVEAATAVEASLERLRSGHVIITSRLSGWSLQVSTLGLQVLDEGAAVEFLLERSGRSRTALEKESAKALAVRLDGLALALEQSGAYIKERGISFDRYLDLFDARRAEVLKWHDARLMCYPVSVAATWLTSFEQFTPAARTLLDTLAFLAPDPIPRSMIGRGIDGPEAEEALAELSRYSLVRFLDEPPDTFSIHRLVQKIVCGRLSGTAREAWEKAVGLLSCEAPKDSEDVSTWNAWRRLAPHCAAVLTETNSQSIPASAIQLMRGYAGFLTHGNSEYAVAEPLYRRALDASEHIFGLEHSDTLACLNNLAWLLYTKGDYMAAEPLYRRALEAQERVLGAEHPDTLTSINNLALLFHAKGALAAAEPLYRQALKVRERVLGIEHSDTLISLNNLALLLKSKGDFVTAESLYRRTLDARERLLGPEHPDTLTSLNNLAVLLKSKGDLSAAEPLYRRALDTRQRVLGKENPQTLTSLSNLALLLQIKGDLAGAEPLHFQALEMRERVLGRQHPDTITSLNNLALFFKANGDLAAAELHNRRVLEVCERALGADHPHTLTSLNNLAALLQAKDDFGEAEPLYLRALEARERVLGADHPHTLISINNLAVMLQAKGDLEKAEPFYRRALEAQKRVLGPNHPQTLTAVKNLAALLKSKEASGKN